MRALPEDDPLTHVRQLAQEGRVVAEGLQRRGLLREAALVQELADRIEHLHEALAYAG